MKACGVCGALFEARGRINGWRRRYCSQECARRAKTRLQAERDAACRGPVPFDMADPYAAGRLRADALYLPVI